MQVLVADEINSVSNQSSLNFIRPFDRGFLTNWESEIQVILVVLACKCIKEIKRISFKIFSRLLGNQYLNVNPSATNLVLTEAPFAPDILQNDTNEVH